MGAASDENVVKMMTFPFQWTGQTQQNMTYDVMIMSLSYQNDVATLPLVPMNTVKHEKMADILLDILKRIF